MEKNIIETTRILNPTSIDLGEYVINPYKGCVYGCIYCYVRFNKTTLKDKRNWGEYVDIKINSPKLLIEKLKNKNVKEVLLGSTTECFQPVERKYNLTKEILEILNKNKIYYNILTRSPLIKNYIPLLKEKYLKKIYFTFNNFNRNYKFLFEHKAPKFTLRVNAINTLLDNNINVIPYFCPIMPFISNYKDVFSKFNNPKSIDFEGLNFNLGNIQEIIKLIETQNKHLGSIYSKMFNDIDFYQDTWNNIKKEIQDLAIKNNIKSNIFIHNFKDYFKNSYNQD